MPVTEKTIIIEAPMDKCFEVIVDYQRYPDFLSEMSRVTLLRREQDYAVATFELDLMVRVKYTLRLFEQPPSAVRWSLERGKIMRVNNGWWNLKDLGSGRTEATYRLELELKGLIPGSVTTKLAGTTLPSTLEAFKRRIESLTP